MSKIVEQNSVVTLLKPNTQQKLIHGANRAGVSPDTWLNTLLDDEIERQRLLSVSDKISQERAVSTGKPAPSQKIAKICNQHLSVLDHESESFAIRTAIENLHTDLLRQNLISVNAREGSIVESKRLKTSRVAYYWYASILAKRHVVWCAGCLFVARVMLPDKRSCVCWHARQCGSVLSGVYTPLQNIQKS